jgi:2-oxoglutarate dehydrogenase E1 component
MAHRGRLSTLYNIFNKPAERIFEEFLEKQQLHQVTDFDETGDVKYHMGYNMIKSIKDKKIKLSLVPNPSHLEAVNPLVYGICRARQDELPGDEEARKRGVLPVVIHGDAAIAGQGVVYESIQLHDLHNYSVGGVIHIVVNNQVGFTTAAIQSRSTPYCTEIAKVVGAPILHVNGDRPDLVTRCIEFAFEYRQRFQKDVFIDVVGFRKFGHNEQDQPGYTQPIMYDRIQKKASVWAEMTDRLVSQKVITRPEADSIYNHYKQQLQDSYDTVVKNREWKDKTEPIPAVSL